MESEIVREDFRNVSTLEPPRSIAADAPQGETAVTGAEAAAATANALESTLQTQDKVNQHLVDGDDLSDDEITNWMRHR